MVRLSGIILLIIITLPTQGQQPDYNYYYRVYFKDKGSISPGDYIPSQLLSEKAVIRREKAGIDLIDYSDLPVNRQYINEITSLGLTLHCSSKWMNTALFKSNSLVNTSIITDLTFVSSVKTVKKPGIKNTAPDKLLLSPEETNESPYDRPVTMLNGYILHNQGFYGNGILIAVLDGGFYNAEEISSLAEMRGRNGIKATYDFVLNSEYVYNSSTHGTAVLSVLAGKLPYSIEGTAQKADYLLLKTEDVSSEFPCEEDYWAAGAEFADSAGADIITTSLGYSTFDDPLMSYKYSDIDGKTAYVTIAADIAASKGMVVFSSAGNERNKTWKRIICPSDGTSVIAVGAVDGNNQISDFSSAGPSYDRRIKPDNSAMGVSVPAQTGTSVVRVSGTSFSCPVLSGMTACLMQAVPEAKNTDIIKVLRESADKYTTPDSLYGFGIPDMGQALIKLQDLFLIVPDQFSVAAPNPTTGEFEIIFKEQYQSVIAELFTSTGKLIWKKEIDTFAGRSLKINELVNREQGLYLIRLTTPSASSVHKIIKLRK